MKAILIISIFFLMSALLIVSNYNLALYKGENLVEFGKLYLSWISQIYENLQAVTGNVVQMDWIPQ
jgi:hypothetical protein